MKLIKANSDKGAKALLQRLTDALDGGKRVLWLLSGGSNIPIEVSIMNELRGYEKNLSIMLTDERYGPVGHKDSNWQQLKLGGFEPGNATTLPTLKKNLSFEQTTKNYGEKLYVSLQGSDITLGQFGIGDDGHIAGILPSAAEAAQTSTLMAICYKTATYNRITMTFNAIQKLTAAYCFVYGTTKLNPLEQLKSQSLDLSEQPAQILKKMTESYVYNDQLGDSYE